MITPIVTVIIPDKSAPDLVLHAIGSIHSQLGISKNLIEIIVVIDHNPKYPKTQITKKFSSVRIVDSRDQEGPGGTRNHGLKFARGKYITFLDSDDNWKDKFLSMSIQTLEKDENTIATLALSDPFFEKISLEKKLNIYFYNTIKDMVLISSYILNHGTLPPSGFYLPQISHLLIRKTALKGFRFDYKYRRGGEDWSLFSHLFTFGKIRILPLRLVNFRYHQSSSTMEEINQLLKWHSYQTLISTLPQSQKEGILYHLFTCYLKLRGGKNSFPNNNSKFKKLILYTLTAGIQFPHIFSNWYVPFLKFFNSNRENLDFTLRLRSGEQFILSHFLDSLMFYEIWNQDVYKLAKLHFPRAIVDVGANIGVFSIRAAQLFPQAKVYSVEPSKESYSHLISNIKSNQITNIIPVNFALFGKPGKKRFYSTGPAGLRSLYPVKGRKQKVTTVSSITLSHFIHSYKLKKIDLLKLDCEGSEYSILSKIGSTEFRKIKSIAMEYHDGEFGHHSQLLELLNRHNFKLKIVSHPIESNIGYIYATNVG